MTSDLAIAMETIGQCVEWNFKLGNLFFQLFFKKKSSSYCKSTLCCVFLFIYLLMYIYVGNCAADIAFNTNQFFCRWSLCILFTLKQFLAANQLWQSASAFFFSCSSFVLSFALPLPPSTSANMLNLFSTCCWMLCMYCRIACKWLFFFVQSGVWFTLLFLLPLPLLLIQIIYILESIGSFFCSSRGRIPLWV